MNQVISSESRLIEWIDLMQDMLSHSQDAADVLDDLLCFDKVQIPFTYISIYSHQLSLLTYNISVQYTAHPLFMYL